MEKQTMLVTEALNELKTLDARINRAIINSSFIASAKKIETKVTSNMSKNEFIEKAKADVQSIKALIERRKLIKAAIVESNASTFVTIGTEKFTVADAIERKTSIQYEKDLLGRMKAQYNQNLSLVNMKNVEVETKIDNLVATAFGKDSKTTIKPEDYNTIANPYREANEWALVDPLDLKTLVEELETTIENFEANVDSALQISNCVTFISLE